MMTRDVLLEMDQEEEDDDDGDIGERGVLRRGPGPEEVGDYARALRSARGRLAGTRGRRGGGSPHRRPGAAVRPLRRSALSGPAPGGGRGGAGRARAPDRRIWAGRGRSA